VVELMVAPEQHRRRRAGGHRLARYCLLLRSILGTMTTVLDWIGCGSRIRLDWISTRGIYGVRTHDEAIG
jgi:hypothetical protein